MKILNADPFTNCDSFLTKFNGLRLLLPTIQSPNICLPETWLAPSMSVSEVPLNSYKLFRSSRAVPRRGGGVALWEKSLLMPTGLVIDVAIPYMALCVASYTFYVY